MPYLQGFLIATLSSLVLAGLSELLAPRLRLVDRSDSDSGSGSDERKIHRGERPIGGVAILVGFLLGAGPVIDWSRALTSLFLGAVMIFGLGLADDLRGLRAKTKLFFQALAALSPILWGGIWVRSIALPGVTLELELGSWGIPLTLLWLMGITNALNFLDGLDGLAAGSSCIFLGFIALFAQEAEDPTTLLLALVLLGATAGLLRYNLHPARVFLGNEGAYLLGFLLGVLALEPFASGFGQIGDLPASAPILLLGLPIADTIFAIIRRACAGRSIFSPDRGHIHHRLLERWGYRRALAMLYGISLALGLLALAGRWRWLYTL